MTSRLTYLRRSSDNSSRDMDVIKLSLLSLILLTTACSSRDPGVTFFRDPTAQCANSAVKNSYLVKYKTGEVAEMAMTKEELHKWIKDTNAKEVVSAVEPNFKIQIDTQKISASATTTTNGTWGLYDINASAVYAAGFYGQNVVVGIIDSGIDTTHPQLVNRFAMNAVEVNGKPGVDDDNNGFIDDLLSWNFSSSSNDVSDTLGHGTHVAGIIAAENTGISANPVGVAPQAKVLPIVFLDSSGGGYISDAIKAIDYARSRKVNVINASWGGGGCSTILQEKILALADQGILFVSAAGNESQDVDKFLGYPASLNLKNQITVGALDSDDSMATYSNFGLTNVHIMAPGSNILSTYPSSTTHVMSGTSMATPFVVGAAALLKSAAPSADYSLIKQALIQTADVRGYMVQSHGKLNVSAAYQWLKSH